MEMIRAALVTSISWRRPLDHVKVVLSDKDKIHQHFLSLK